MEYKVSVIVPLFYGNKYINRIVNMLQENVRYSEGKCDLLLELIFINDSPDSSIDVPEESCYIIKSFSNDQNRGIHYSRVHGLRMSKGEYVLFLDQDDVISDHYFYEQCLSISDYDMSICNGYDSGVRLFDFSSYISGLREEVDTDEFARLIYPGQALIRKASIPPIWLNCIMKTKGSDDLFLWMLMFAGTHNKHRFNDKVLYNHIQNGNNTSNNIKNTIESDKEVFDILFEKKQINKSEYDHYCSKLNARLKDIEDESIDLIKSKRIQAIMSIWIRLLCSGYNLGDCLRKKGILNVAIYGYGILGQMLNEQLRGSGVNVMSIFDRREYSVQGVKTSKIGDEIPKVDLIILTISGDCKQIENDLNRAYKYNTIHIEELLSLSFELD